MHSGLLVRIALAYYRLKERKDSYELFITCMSFPPKISALVSSVLGVPACIPASAHATNCQHHPVKVLIAVRSHCYSPAAETLYCSSATWFLELGAGPKKKVSEDAQEQLKIKCKANA